MPYFNLCYFYNACIYLPQFKNSLGVMNMKKKTIDRYFCSIETEIDTEEIGEGYFCSEIAEMCGVFNKTNNNPNKKLIKEIADFYQLKPSGFKYSNIYNTSNNSPYGYHSHETPMYDGQELDFIRNVIKDCDISDSKGYYHFRETVFRKDNSIRIFMNL